MGDLANNLKQDVTRTEEARLESESLAGAAVVIAASRSAWEAFERAESLHHDGAGYFEGWPTTRPEEVIRLNKFKELRDAWITLRTAYSETVREQLSAANRHAVMLETWVAGNVVECVFQMVEYVLCDFLDATCHSQFVDWYPLRRTEVPPIPSADEIKVGREQIRLHFRLYEMPNRDLVRQELLKEVGRLPRREASPDAVCAGEQDRTADDDGALTKSERAAIRALVQLNADGVQFPTLIRIAIMAKMPTKTVRNMSMRLQKRGYMTKASKGQGFSATNKALELIGTLSGQSRDIGTRD